MTNGEKLQSIFSTMRINVMASYVQVMGVNYEFNNLYPLDWWNTEYKEPIEKCKWIKYDYRTMCPKGHDIDNPYWRIPQNRMETLKYCPYCGKEIEVEE